MRLFILSLLALVCFAGDPPTQPQPPEVIQALAAYEKSVVAARKVYDTAEAKARGDAVAALQKVQEAYMKKGDLEGAVLVKEAVRKLNAGETLVLVEENLKKVQDLLGTSAPSIVGKWRRGSDVFTFTPDFKCRISKGVTGTWSEKDGIVTAVWSDGGKDEFTSINKEAAKTKTGLVYNFVK